MVSLQLLIAACIGATAAFPQDLYKRAAAATCSKNQVLRSSSTANPQTTINHGVGWQTYNDGFDIGNGKQYPDSSNLLNMDYTVQSVPACMDQCVAWNQAGGNTPCTSIAYVNQYTACFLYAQAPSCGFVRDYDVYSAVLGGTNDVAAIYVPGTTTSAKPTTTSSTSSSSTAPTTSSVVTTSKPSTTTSAAPTTTSSTSTTSAISSTTKVSTTSTTSSSSSSSTSSTSTSTSALVPPLPTTSSVKASTTSTSIMAAASPSTSSIATTSSTSTVSTSSSTSTVPTSTSTSALTSTSSSTSTTSSSIPTPASTSTSTSTTSTARTSTSITTTSTVATAVAAAVATPSSAALVCSGLPSWAWSRWCQSSQTLINQIIANTANPASLSKGFLVPLYIYPSWWSNPSAWDWVFNAAANYPGVTFTVIINPSSGPVASPNSDYVHELVKFAAVSNIVMLGYIDTAYGSRSTSDVSNDISMYAGWTTIDSRLALDGIYFDNQASSMDHLSQYSGYASQVRSNGAFLAKTVGFGPGTICNPSYIDLADFVVVFEASTTLLENNVFGWYQSFLTGLTTTQLAKLAWIMENADSTTSTTVANLQAAFSSKYLYISDGASFSAPVGASTLTSMLNLIASPIAALVK